jgi:hypothetical protein
MDRSKFAAVGLCILILTLGFIVRATAGGKERSSDEISFMPVETKGGWMVEGHVGDMTFRTKELTFQSDLFPAARVYAARGFVVLIHSNKSGDEGTQSGKKIQLSLRHAGPGHSH